MFPQLCCVMTPMLTNLEIASPMGPIVLAATDHGLRAVNLNPKGTEISKTVSKSKGDFKRSAILREVRAWFEKYFAGHFLSPHTVPMDLTGSPFELKVWRELLEIPVGTCLTYGELAANIGQRGAAQAVGGAVGRNPIAILIPCHRVIGKTGTLTGFGGGLLWKRWLLRHEGFQVEGAQSNSKVSQPGTLPLFEL